MTIKKKARKTVARRGRPAALRTSPRSRTGMTGPARKNAHSPRPASTAGNSLEPLQCSHCPKQIARKYMANHLRKVHGVEPTTATNHGSSQAAAAAVA